MTINDNSTSQINTALLALSQVMSTKRLSSLEATNSNDDVEVDLPVFVPANGNNTWGYFKYGKFGVCWMHYKLPATTSRTLIRSIYDDLTHCWIDNYNYPIKFIKNPVPLFRVEAWSCRASAAAYADPGWPYSPAVITYPTYCRVVLPFYMHYTEPIVFTLSQWEYDLCIAGQLDPSEETTIK